MISYFNVTLLYGFCDLGSLKQGFLTSVILLTGSIADIYWFYTNDRSGVYARIKIIIIFGLGTIFAIINLIFLTDNLSEVGIILVGFSFFAAFFYLACGTLQALIIDLVPQNSRIFFYSIVFSLGLIVSSISLTIFGILLDLFGS